MPDPAAADVQTPGPAAAPAAAPAPAATGQGPSRAERRAERRAAAIARIQGRASDAPAAAAATADKPTLQEAAPAAPSKPAEAAPPAPAAADKPATPAEPDPATERGLRQVEAARKKWLEERAAHQAELDVQRAEIARLRKEAEGKVTSREDLRKLRGAELLDVLDHLDEDDYDILSREAYARTKAGQTDPRAQAAAQEARRAQGGRAAQAELERVKAELEELRAELRGEFTRRDQASFAQRWVGEAVKAIPSDKPTFLSKLHANEPDTAARELLTIGAELEKANDGEAPTHAEVIAEFEKRKRASLKAMGLDPDALLAPPAAAPATQGAPAKPAGRTLDPSASTVTRPESMPKTRDERRDRALAKIRDRQRTTADQQQ